MVEMMNSNTRLYLMYCKEDGYIRVEVSYGEIKGWKKPFANAAHSLYEGTKYQDLTDVFMVKGIYDLTGDEPVMVEGYEEYTDERGDLDYRLVATGAGV